MAWTAQEPDFDSNIHVRVLNAEGAVIASGQIVNSNLAGSHINPAVTALPDVGAATFTGAAGELRFANHFLEGDINGDGAADFSVHLNVASLTTNDFLL